MLYGPLGACSCSINQEFAMRCPFSRYIQPADFRDGWTRVLLTFHMHKIVADRDVRKVLFLHELVAPTGLYQV